MLSYSDELYQRQLWLAATAIEDVNVSEHGQTSLVVPGEDRPLPGLAPDPPARRCFCPDDCSCRSPHRTNVCGCRAHAPR